MTSVEVTLNLEDVQEKNILKVLGLTNMCTGYLNGLTASLNNTIQLMTSQFLMEKKLVSISVAREV